MKAFYVERPTAEAMAYMGYRETDFPDDLVEIWPENAAPFEMFSRFCTQWRVGFGGPYGLDFTVFLHELDRQGLSREAYDEQVAALQIIERTALASMKRK